MPIWRDEIAALLGLTHSHIETIQNLGSGKTPKRCLDEVLEKWRKMDASKTGDHPYTWKGLLELLEDAEVKVLASDIKKALLSEFSTVRGNLGQRNREEGISQKGK